MLPIIILIVFVLIVVAGIYVVGKQLPTHWEIEHATFIRARPQEIFPYINEPGLWEQWSVWDSDTEIKGEPFGVGASLIWLSGGLKGQMTITFSKAPHEIQYHLDINQGKFVINGTIVLSITDADFTQMAWRCTARPPKHFQFLLRYQLYFLKNFFIQAMEQSLLGMQELFETEE